VHELAIANRLLDRALAAAEEADTTRVETLHVALGAATHLVPEQVQFCLRAVAEDTPVEGADVQIEQVPARGECDCGWAGELRSLADTVAGAPDRRCPDCGTSVSVTAGRECRLTSIDVPDATDDAVRRQERDDADARDVPDDAAPRQAADDADRRQELDDRGDR
jgi:hydrogenase nickel incorporation protein HypA/HybF